MAKVTYLRSADIIWPRKVRIKQVAMRDRRRQTEVILTFEDEPKRLLLTKGQALALIDAFQYRFVWVGSEVLLAPGADEMGQALVLVTPVSAPNLDVNPAGSEVAAYLRALYFD